MPTETINGHTHHFEDLGQGEPLVYLAATRFDSARAWVPYMQQYAKGYRVIMPDPRGLAGSSHVSTVAPADWVTDLATLLDTLKIPSVNLVAETLGTRIATRFAADHPDRVNTLILNGTIAYSSASGDAQRASTLSDQRKKDLETHHGADWEQVNSFYINLHARPEFHEFYDLRTVAPRVSTPTLVMRGDIDDPVHPVIHSAELHALFPKSWLAIFPNTEFNAMRGRPEESWTLINEFVKTRGEAPAKMRPPGSF